MASHHPSLSSVAVHAEVLVTVTRRDQLIASARDPKYSGVMQHLRSWEEIEGLLLGLADELEAADLTPKNPIPETNIINDRCTHTKFAIKAKVEKQFDVTHSQIIAVKPQEPKHTVKMSVQCNECGMSFRFVDTGFVSLGGTELRANILPKSIMSDRKPDRLIG
jgi:hypothetical protein